MYTNYVCWHIFISWKILVVDKQLMLISWLYQMNNGLQLLVQSAVQFCSSYVDCNGLRIFYYTALALKKKYVFD